MFGPRVGFMKFKAEVTQGSHPVPIPGIVFMRGGSVGNILCIDRQGKKSHLYPFLSLYLYIYIYKYISYINRIDL